MAGGAADVKVRGAEDHVDRIGGGELAKVAGEIGGVGAEVHAALGEGDCICGGELAEVADEIGVVGAEEPAALREGRVSVTASLPVRVGVNVAAEATLRCLLGCRGC